MTLVIRSAQSAKRRRALERPGFTLVELLTVIAVIGMLSAISITTVRAAIQSARETQTRTTIAKIDSVLTAAYEKYQYRRVDLSDIEVIKNRFFNGGYSATNAEYAAPGAPESRLTPLQSAQARVRLMRELLRRDFPCSEDELNPYEDGEPIAIGLGSAAPRVTPLQEAYLAEIRLSANGALSNETDSPGVGNPMIANAELLYLVITNVEPEARALFAEREVADLDGNGLKEFVDGWGRPICWMRWAPGLERSDRQPYWEDVPLLRSSAEIGKRVYVDDTTPPNFDPSADSDPFDPLSVSDGWFVVPYVYSAGNDGEFGLYTPYDAVAAGQSVLDPFAQRDAENPQLIGMPVNSSYKDNIDNHTLVR